jgi:hypothetical protein
VVPLDTLTQNVGTGNFIDKFKHRVGIIISLRAKKKRLTEEAFSD